MIGQLIHHIGDEARCNGYHRQINSRHCLSRWKTFDALNLCFFGVDHIKLTCITSFEDIFQDFSARFFNIVGTSNHYNAFRMCELPCYHKDADYCLFINNEPDKSKDLDGLFLKSLVFRMI